jgi:DNA helicase-2/ATP-dependent DNA helicase PcrA
LFIRGEDILNATIEKLNSQQKEAALHGDGPILVLAGAGSGKTRVITYRIAHLMQDLGVKPHEILAVTFTNKAAREMESRIRELAGEIRLPWMGTFHAICAKILRIELPPLGRPGNFTIIDTSDQLSIIREALKELNVDDKKFPPRSVLNSISTAKNHLKTAADFQAEAHGFYPELISKVYNFYQDRLDENRAMDFDDLIMQAVILFRTHREILEKYQEKFRHVLVDEYQDVNHSQYTLTSLLAGGHRNLCVVGDDDQSIYGFRGADVSIILRFERDFPGAKVVKLEENYRSSGVVLSAAHSIVKDIKGRKSKKLWTRKPGGERIGVNACTDGREEARFIIKEINSWREKGRKFKDFVVLYRTNAQSRSIEEVFKQEGIDYDIVGGVRFYERAEIKDALAYLRLIANPWDFLSFRRIANVPSRGIGSITQDKIIKCCQDEKKHLLEIMKSAQDLSRVGKKIQDTLSGFADVILRLKKHKDKLGQPPAEGEKGPSLSAFIKKVLEETGYFHMLDEDPDPRSIDRRENLDELVNDAREFEGSSPDPSLEAFLEKVSLFADIDAKADSQASDEGKVTLMTVHSAKGLEFPIVFIAGLEEGLFPHERSVSSLGESALDEERRLFYVAMTRTMEKVYLTFARERTLHGKTHNQSPSRFLREIPEELIDRYLPEVSRRSFTRKVPSVLDKPAPKTAEAPTGFSPGDAVGHKMFGRGTIISTKQGYATVSFETAGQKTLSETFLYPWDGPEEDLKPGAQVKTGSGLEGIVKKTEGDYAYIILSNGDLEKIKKELLSIKKD